MVICSVTLEEGCAISTSSVDQHRDSRPNLSFSFSFNFSLIFKQGLLCTFLHFFSFFSFFFILETQCPIHVSQDKSVF